MTRRTALAPGASVGGGDPARGCPGVPRRHPLAQAHAHGGGSAPATAVTVPLPWARMYQRERPRALPGHDHRRSRRRGAPIRYVDLRQATTPVRRVRRTGARHPARGPAGRQPALPGAPRGRLGDAVPGGRQRPVPVQPSELLYLVDDDFRHPVTGPLPAAGTGWTTLPPGPGGANLDYIRGNLFDPAGLRTLPADATGEDNDLADLFDHYLRRAAGDPDARLYVLRRALGPRTDRQDKVFGFLPGNGVHDIHMNQGNSRRFSGDDGVWQDGGLLVHFPTSRAGSASVPRLPEPVLAYRRHHRPCAGGHRRRGPSPAPSRSGSSRPSSTRAARRRRPRPSPCSTPRRPRWT